jgi:hypothetical protein
MRVIEGFKGKKMVFCGQELMERLEFRTEENQKKKTIKNLRDCRGRNDKTSTLSRVA